VMIDRFLPASPQRLSHQEFEVLFLALDRPWNLEEVEGSSSEPKFICYRIKALRSAVVPHLFDSHHQGKVFSISIRPIVWNYFVHLSSIFHERYCHSS
jgi:hypothetical protein